MSLDLSHFGLLVFGFLISWPRTGGPDRHDRVAWALVGIIFVAIAIQWQHVHGWPGVTRQAILAMMLYLAMFALGLVWSWGAASVYATYTKYRTRRVHSRF